MKSATLVFWIIVCLTASLLLLSEAEGMDKIQAEKVCRSTGYQRCDLVMSIVEIESSFNPSAYNPDGSYGLMMLQCSTARIFASKHKFNNCQDLFNPILNMRIGIEYLKYLESHGINSDMELLSAYNAGPAYSYNRKTKKSRLSAKRCTRHSAEKQCVPGSLVSATYIHKVMTAKTKYVFAAINK